MQLFSSFWDYIEVMDAKQNYKHEANKKKRIMLLSITVLFVKE